MSYNEMRPWRCENGHVLGVVVRNGSGVRQLALYREAINLDPFPGGEEGEVDVMAVVEGYVADVRCSICGCPRTWVPGQESQRRLLRKYGMVDGKR